jgi:hypothetical protein
MRADKMFSTFFSSFYKGQSATEYIIILALVLTLALIVFATISIFPAFSYSGQVGDSIRYWSSAASPIAILDYKQTSDTFEAALENRADATLQITAFNLSTSSATYSAGSPLTLAAGERKIASITTVDCSGEQTLRYDVYFQYSTSEVSGLEQKGLKGLYVTCSD